MATGRPGGARGGGSLHTVMRAGRLPDPVILAREIETAAEQVTKSVEDPEKDVWVTTVDGRYQSPMIELRVGPSCEVFKVHADILRRGEYFRKCLDGNFKEKVEGVIDLPEEDASVFSFVIVWLYEGVFNPLKLQPTSPAADRKPQQTQGNNQRGQKQLNRHRPSCTCNRCTHRRNHCSVCGRKRRLDGWDNGWTTMREAETIPAPPPHNQAPNTTFSIVPEDIAAAFSTYNLSVQVYIRADRYLIPELKSLVSRYIIDQFERYGLLFAKPSILDSLLILAENLCHTDRLLRKIFARIGLLTATLWREYPDEMGRFFVENPEVAGLLMQETVERVKLEKGPDWLLPMDWRDFVDGDNAADE